MINLRWNPKINRWTICLGEAIFITMAEGATAERAGYLLALTTDALTDVQVDIQNRADPRYPLVRDAHLTQFG